MGAACRTNLIIHRAHHPRHLHHLALFVQCFAAYQKFYKNFILTLFLWAYGCFFLHNCGFLKIFPLGISFSCDRTRSRTFIQYCTVPYQYIPHQHLDIPHATPDPYLTGPGWTCSDPNSTKLILYRSCSVRVPTSTVKRKLQIEDGKRREKEERKREFELERKVLEREEEIKKTKRIEKSENKVKGNEEKALIEDER